MKRIYIFFALLTMAICAMAQRSLDLPKTTLDGSEYYYYDVKQGDTFFSLSKRFGLTIEELKSYNPSAADGLQAYMRLYIPVYDTIDKPVQPTGTTTHTVAKGETLYGISKKYGMTVDEVLALNPQVRDGFRTGDVLKVTPRNDIPTERLSTVGGQTTHTIAKGETLYRIASENGITVDELLNANPGLSTASYKVGQTIVIPRGTQLPKPAKPEPRAESKIAPDTVTDLNRYAQETARHTYGERQTVETPTRPTAIESPTRQPEAPVAVVNDGKTYEIAIMLPFMLYEMNPSTAAQHFTDFYRGFLLAAQKSGADSPKINIRAYDTAASLDTVTMLMSRPELKHADIIVGPENEQQFDYIVNQVDPDKTYVVNTFANKSDAHTTSSNVIQTNIPREEMYARAVGAFIAELDGRTPVFLARKRGSADKNELVSKMKEQLRAADLQFVEIAFENLLNDEDLAELSADGDYVFIPITASRAEFQKFAPTIKKFKENSHAGNHTAIFGYPEWLLFRGDLAEMLNQLEAVVYSRFYADPHNPQTRRLASEFEANYGQRMIETVPSQALLGYDTGMFLISVIKDGRGDFRSYKGAHGRQFDGLQTDFDLEGTKAPGLVNNSLKLIKYAPGKYPQVVKI